MNKDNNSIENNEIKLIKIINVPIKKKQWFIGAFLIVFLSQGFSFLF